MSAALETWTVSAVDSERPTRFTGLLARRLRSAGQARRDHGAALPLPPEKFGHLTAAGTADQVADTVLECVAAGASLVTLLSSPRQHRRGGRPWVR